MPRWCLPHRPPTEAALVRETGHYQKLLSRYRARTDALGKRLWIAYRLQIALRHQLLVALKAGRPQAWADYPATVSVPGSMSALDHQRDIRDGFKLLRWMESVTMDRPLARMRRALRQHLAHKRELVATLVIGGGDGQGNARV